VLSPHPDDAVLSAWTTLRAGDPEICNVCTVAPPPGFVSDFDRVFGVDDSNLLVEQRLREDATALRVAGCREPVGLGFLDAQYRTEPMDLDGLTDAISRVTADAEWICVPAAIGAHPDHVAVRNCALGVAARSGIPTELYADLPYAVRFGWPSWVTGKSKRPYLVPDALWAADLDSVPLPISGLEPRAIALDDAEIACKVRALACYETQNAALDAGPIGRITNAEVIGFEVRWRVTFA
jgi:LmbE family N-acetylglucosaminyl deacetylase